MEQLATAREQAATREATLSKELQAEKTQSEKLNVAFRKDFESRQVPKPYEENGINKFDVSGVQFAARQRHTQSIGSR
eukprot:3217519-Amphidinium_carterae.1